MSKNELITADDFINYHTKQCKGTVRTAMKEFAKMHVKAQLKTILNKVKISDDKWDNIINAYPQNKIV